MIQEISSQIRGAQSIILRHLGVSRQAFHKWQHWVPSTWEQHDVLLQESILKHYEQHRHRIGATKLLLYVQHDETIQFPVTIKQVKRIMTKLHITCQSRVKKHYRQKQAEREIQENILNQEFNSASAPNQVWLSDSTELTYGLHGEHKVRLCGVLDLYGRYLLSYQISATETSEAMVQTFEAAFKQAGDVHPLVHTDRGSAFTAHKFDYYLIGHNVLRSMSRPGTPYDNAPMERWWNEFKLNWMDSHPTPKTLQELLQLVREGVHYFN
ncbi:IS3 family transposase, partial [Secundilactobacillus pentosiphilus]|uniref:IS3 family transposase n=1 Tax=Secundilactobacillus pentosiphilus TaxID=1714682 RepID=UPI0015C59CA8